MSVEEKLRDELMSLEGARQQLARWKIVGLGALAAVGLGVESRSNQNMVIILSLIPLFAAYCDLINSEYEIRVALIAAFLRTPGGLFEDYESFYQSKEVQNTKWWDVVTGVSLTPSLFACFLVCFVGLSIIFFPNIMPPSLAIASESLFATAIVLIVSAVISTVITIKINNNLLAKHLEILNINYKG